MNPDIAAAEAQIQDALQALEPSKRHRALRKFLTAALGSIPWVGGFIAAAQAFREESGQIHKDELQRQWLEEHRIKMRALAADLAEVVARLQGLGDEIQDRLESEQYLALVRKAFRGWDEADTQEKRGYIKKLISNAGASTLCPDDLIRLFLSWLSQYHEAHFMVIREIYQNPGSTRRQIWDAIHTELPKENSAEADLFRLLVGDLSLGRVVRQHREVNYDGQFVKKPAQRRGASSGVMKSAFDDQEAYELTELGRQFVHYVFTDIVPRIENTDGSPNDQPE